MKIYIACGLTHVPRDEFQAYVSFLELLVDGLANLEKTKVKYALRDSDPQLAHKPYADRARLCYTWDKQMVEWADVVIAEASYPSTGLGIELQVACNREIPVLLVFKQKESHRAKPVKYQTTINSTCDLQLGDGFVSLMALGLPNIFKVLPYIDSDDALSQVNSAIQTLRLPNNTEHD
ncbi:MAG: hypothetical protein KF836_06280 [Fimbriimonadaceae bacterium]|nr:hypothetical protein [Fimbriimonadaceae bacterium]